MRSADLLAYVFAGGKGLKLVAVCGFLAGAVFTGVVFRLGWLHVAGLILTGVANVVSIVWFGTAALDSTGAKGSGDATELVSALFLFLWTAAVLAFAWSRLW